MTKGTGASRTWHDNPQVWHFVFVRYLVFNEFSTTDPAVQQLIGLATRRFREVFEQAFAQAQSCGEIPATRAPAALALYMHCSMSGLRTQVKSGLQREDLLSVIEMVMANLS
ncbi:hypothetical protein V2S84_17745 [Azotobacter chroococcum]|nr:hypothetical protein [Azotobacter chroococcum]